MNKLLVCHANFDGSYHGRIAFSSLFEKAFLQSGLFQI